MFEIEYTPFYARMYGFTVNAAGDKGECILSMQCTGDLFFTRPNTKALSELHIISIISDDTMTHSQILSYDWQCQCDLSSAIK